LSDAWEPHIGILSEPHPRRGHLHEMKQRFFVAIVGLLAAGLPVWCQQQYPLRSVTRTVVKPDRVGEFVDIQKQTVDLIKKAGNDRYNVVWQVAVGNTNEYWSVSPMSKIGTGVGGDLLAVDAQREIHLVQETSDRIGRDRNVDLLKNRSVARHGPRRDPAAGAVANSG
jgi:hypothetical protein